jgi:hypothetical protein
VVTACTTCSNNQQLPTEFIYGFHPILRINSDIALNSIRQLISVMEMRCVFFEIGDEFLNIILMSFCFKWLKLRPFMNSIYNTSVLCYKPSFFQVFKLDVTTFYYIRRGKTHLILLHFTMLGRTKRYLCNMIFFIVISKCSLCNHHHHHHLAVKELDHSNKPTISK